MAEAPAVALLFDDAELGAHLREALRERGARIVHEGALGTLSRDVIHGTGAQVVVVNLDDHAADELDRLYDVIDGDHPRVVFNDAQASRGLDGWDRARWARHLAVKVLAEGDVDPPRPADALAVETPVPHEAVAVAPVATVAEVFAEPVAEPEAAPPAEFEPVAEFAQIDESPEILLSPVVGEAADVSESLAAELEALLAADTDEPVEDEFGSGLKPIAEDAPPLHDGMFGADFLADTHGPAPMPPVHQDVVAQVPPPLPLREELTASVPTEPLDASPSAARPSFQLDHLALTPLDDSFMPADTPIKVEKISTAEALHAGWSLVDDDAPLAEAPAADFGIEKMSAVDYLAHDVEELEDAPLIEPGMTLELVSIEEAIAPREEYSNEVHLGELSSALGRVLLLGATVDSTDSVCAFLAALPSSLRMAVLLTQHQGAASVEALSERLSKSSALPVRIASHGHRARAGEVLLVPANRQVRLLRDGRVECEAVDVASFQNPSIDSAFTTAANVFGRDAVAIVFAGPGTDAVGGAQAVHDRGGKVWVEQASGDHYADMVHGVEAERLASFTGTPFELAARLIEEEVQR